MTPLGEIECCMCGDSGLSGELYRCRVCLFRSQHRYCSNQYPKAGVYRVCNWCLITPTPKQDSSDPISSRDDETLESDRGNDKRSRKKSLPGEQSLQLRSRDVGTGRIKKASEVSPAPATTPRKRIITRGALEEKLRSMKSDEIAKRGIIRPSPGQEFRKVVRTRRYKLLNEVLC